MYIPCMTHRYSIAEARATLPAILDQAEAGQEIELTRRGKPVAVILSVQAFEHLRNDRPRFGDAYRNFLKRHPLHEVGLDADFVPSTRDRGRGRKVAL